jgi:hypothetical protein
MPKIHSFLAFHTKKIEYIIDNYISVGLPIPAEKLPKDARSVSFKTVIQPNKPDLRDCEGQPANHQESDRIERIN